METIINEKNFKEEVLNSEKPVLLDFWAKWCGPCRMLSPIISEIANEHPEIKVCKVDVDDEESLAVAFSVASIPLLVVMKDGKEIKRSVGYKEKEDILKLLSF